jgi:photosystem II stability/assembly factor-like uncharacterized protein
MKKKILILLVLLSCAASSQTPWISLPTGTNMTLNKIKYGAGRLWALGTNGTLLYSTSQGNNWDVNQTGNNYTYNDIVFATGNTGYLACNGGKILKTVNGLLWNELNTGITADIITLYSITGKIFAAGSGGIMLKSTNSGVNWITLGTYTYEIKSICRSGANMFAAGAYGLILRSTNLGDSWTPVNSYTSNDLQGIFTHPITSDIYACGTSGKLIRSSDTGLSWFTVNTGYNYDYTSMYITDSAIWLASTQGRIINSTNLGTTWLTDHNGTVTINSITYYGTMYAAGINGYALRKFNGNIWLSFYQFDANTISTPYNNLGSFNRLQFTGNAGFEWPKGSNKYARYASGIWLGAKVDGDTLIAMAEYDSEFFPGYTDNTGNPQGKLDSAYRIYKLLGDVNNNDRVKWPNALLGNSDQGAPVYFDSQTNTWKPLDFGWQTMFLSYTDSYPESHGNNAGSTTPLKADIKLLNYAFSQQGSLDHTIISRYSIINRSNKVWNDLYIGLWTDDDVGDATDDMVACDTTLNLGYTYNGDNNDNEYGSAPPAVGFVLLKGPAIYTGNNNDTSWLCNAKTRINKVGYKDKKMDVFNWYYGGAPVYGDPQRYNETYRMLKGLSKIGTQIINPVTNQPTTYFYSGDPVTGQGWINGPMDPNDQRFLTTTGPVNMNPGDTQYIVFAQVIARGATYLNSITQLKQCTQQIIDYYKNCFINIPIGIEPISQNIPDKFELYQNYPNPFNPSSIIRFVIPPAPLQSGDVKLIVYNALGQVVETLVNNSAGSGLNAGTYEVEFDGSNLASGVYYYSLVVENELIDTKKMVLIK